MARLRLNVGDLASGASEAVALGEQRPLLLVNRGIWSDLSCWRPVSSLVKMDVGSYMSMALRIAGQASGDLPVGALVLGAGGKILGSAHNTRENDGDPFGHAEVQAIRLASIELGSWRLSGCTIVVTLEPCPMCASLIMQSRLDRLIFGAFSPRTGAAGSVYDLTRDQRLGHSLEVIGGVMEAECQKLLRAEFRSIRKRCN